MSVADSTGNGDHPAELSADFVSFSGVSYHLVSRHNRPVMYYFFLALARLPSFLSVNTIQLAYLSPFVVVYCFKEDVGSRLIAPELGNVIELRDVPREIALASKLVRPHSGNRH